jgi:hypothetical protein
VNRIVGSIPSARTSSRTGGRSSVVSGLPDNRQPSTDIPAPSRPHPGLIFGLV